MSEICAFFQAVSEMVALDGRLALDYCLDEAYLLFYRAHRDRVDAMRWAFEFAQDIEFDRIDVIE